MLVLAGRVAALAYAAMVFASCTLADKMMFPAPPTSYPELAGPLRAIESEAGSLAVAHLPPPDDKAWVLLHSHGNGEDLGRLLPWLKAVNERGYGVIAYDYPGYGLSEGEPGEGSVYAAHEAVYAWATGELGYRPGRLVLHGRSIGGGAAVDLAVREPAGAVVLESPFVSAYRVMTRIPLLPGDKFRNLAKIREVPCPILIIHGTDDAVIPFWHSQKLARAGGEVTLVAVEGAGHNNLIASAGEDYWHAIGRFLAKAAGPGGPVSPGRFDETASEPERAAHE